jgi:transposase
MKWQALRDWVHRYNAEGIAGLSNRHAAGSTPLVNSEPIHKARLLLWTVPFWTLHRIYSG